MQCVQVNSVGGVELVDPQPADLTTCTAVLLSPSEASPAWYAVPLSADEGAVIGVAVATVWALAWGLRQLAGFFNDRSSEDES